MGRACFPSPFIASAVVATTALAAAGGRRARALLPALALGERICALAVLEESGRLDPDALALPVAAPGRLTGRKLFVSDAHVATDVIVLGTSRRRADRAPAPDGPRRASPRAPSTA